MDTGVSVELFVEILNRYVYYFDQENEAVSEADLFIVCTLSKDGWWLTCFPGHDKIPKRSHRTHPLESLFQRVLEQLRESPTALSADIGLHQIEGVRRCHYGAEMREGVCVRRSVSSGCGDVRMRRDSETKVSTQTPVLLIVFA